MKVLVVGGGGREHALCWKLNQSSLKPTLYCAPGNGGIREVAQCVDIKATDIEGIKSFCKQEQIDLCVVAQDAPLVMGMVDELEESGVACFGPSKCAAMIEGSKSFAKELMKKYNIPTARYMTFEDSKSAIRYAETQQYPLVIKADGLALGKGVIIAADVGEAREAITAMMENSLFGESGQKVVIEEFLQGREISVLCFTDGRTVLPMVSAQDHKRALDGDKGLNTGGMGAFSPSPIYDAQMDEYCMEHIFVPTIKALESEGRLFKGVLYFGLISTDDGVKVIEYNARFGDPEAQCVLMRLKSDLLEIMCAVRSGNLEKIQLDWEEEAAVCIIAASSGYPLEYEVGRKIEGLDECKDVQIFHSGTKFDDGAYYTNGGRVLGVVGMGESMAKAKVIAYNSIAKVRFDGIFYRKDIGNFQK